MNVDRTTGRQTDRQTMKMNGKGGDEIHRFNNFNILISFNDTTRE